MKSFSSVQVPADLEGTFGLAAESIKLMKSQPNLMSPILQGIMDTKKRIAQLDDEHLAFRRKTSELEWDYHDMKREARNFPEEMSNWVISFCRHSSPSSSSYILHQIEKSRRFRAENGWRSTEWSLSKKKIACTIKKWTNWKKEKVNLNFTFPSDESIRQSKLVFLFWEKRMALKWLLYVLK